MIKYIIKRILLFIPTLFFISLLAFVISINSPGDPVDKLSKSVNMEGGANAQLDASKRVKDELRKRLGLDLPVFYLGLGTYADCDTLHKIPDKAHRENLEVLNRRYGNWEFIQAYYLSLKSHINDYEVNIDSVREFYSKAKIIADSLGVSDTITSYKYSKNQIQDAINVSKFTALSLIETNNSEIIDANFNKLDSLTQQYPFFTNIHESFVKIKSNYSLMKSEASAWKIYIPWINWYGVKNQYHLWLFGECLSCEDGQRKGVVRGDFGDSYTDGQPIGEKIGEKFLVSFKLIFLSIVLSYLISIPIGVYAGYKKGGAFDQTSSIVLFVLYSLPSFFIATLLLYTFSNPDTLYWFPQAGLKDVSEFNEDWSVWQKIEHQAPYFIMPLIAYTYSSFAFLSRIMRVGVIDVMKSDYIRTARAKGLSERKVLLKHAFRNSLIPIITVFANVFPAAVGGSVIIEVIFSIQGMGLASFQAIDWFDYPMIVAIFTLSGALTVVGYLVADLLYAIVDPRISLKK